MTEFGFIDHIKELFAALPDNGFEGIGDDCAVLPVGEGESLVFTTDMLAEGVHFLRPATSPRELGRKSLAVNLSDVASMGARPVGTLLSLSLPADTAGTWAEEFMLGYRELSEAFGVTLAGGDTTRSAAGITINVTAIGRIADAHIKRRSGARPGDAILVAGELGLSGAGIIRRLPLLETGIYTIATLFLLRAVAGVAEMAVTGCALLADSTAAFAAAVVGTLYLLGGRRKFGRQESE